MGIIFFSYLALPKYLDTIHIMTSLPSWPGSGTSTAAIGGGVAAALVVLILIIIAIVVLILVVSKSRTEKSYQEHQGKF